MITLNYITHMKKITFIILITLSFFINLSGFAVPEATYRTIKSGDWSDPTVWENGLIPNTTGVNNITMEINHDVVYNPQAPDYPDPMEFQNNFTFEIADGVSLIVNAGVKIKNNVVGTIDGLMQVSGDFEVQGDGNPNKNGIDGNGTLIVGGEVDDPNNVISSPLLNSVPATRYVIVDGGLWSNNDTWAYTSGGVTATVPETTDEVFIETGFSTTLDIDAQIDDIRIESGGTLFIAPGKTLTINNSANVSGAIVLQSDASGTGALIDNSGADIPGQAQLYLSGNAYHYIASPFQSASVDTFIITSWGAVNPNFYYYDETNPNSDWMYGWKKPTEASMIPGKGYAHYFPGDRTFELTGGYFNTGTVTMPVSHSSHGGPSTSWNLIGNPYPSPIDANAFLTTNADSDPLAGLLTGTIYFWDDDQTQGEGYTSSDYSTLNLAGAVSGGNGTVPNGFIGVGQAFFVSANTNGNATFTNSMRTANQATFFKKQKIDSIRRLKLSITNAKNEYNETLISFLSEATEGYDNLYDGKKIIGNPDLALYTTLNEEAYAIQSFPEEVLFSVSDYNVPLTLDAAYEGNYEFEAKLIENFEENIAIFLEDRQTGALINLRETPNYEFSTVSGTEERFVIHFSTLTVSTKQLQADVSSISAFNKTIKIHLNKTPTNAATLEVYDLSGKQLIKKDLYQVKTEITTNLARGIYLVKVQYGNKIKTEKLFLH